MRLAYYLGLFLLALTTLVIEVLLTKIFEVSSPVRCSGSVSGDCSTF